MSLSLLKRFRPVAVVLFGMLLGIQSAAAQAPQVQCGTVDHISFPVDTNTFQIVQDYGSASFRHQGRYHTGEDWYGGRGTSLGQPVRAIANGRVTYASPTGWGRDGGVVILEHILPDESLIYSVYGHMMETDLIAFPAPFTCVTEGEVIGAVGDIRPAPHIHFEIKTNNPTLPGTGYSWSDPFSEGWRDPTKFVLNWQTWLQPAHLWHLDLADERGPISAPIELEDHSLLYLDANRVGRVSPDGRVLWRTALDSPAVGLTNYEGSHIVYADGTLQPINPEDGTLGESWSVGTPVDGAPILWDEINRAAILFHTPDNRLMALSGHRILWTLDDIEPLVRWQVYQQTMALVTEYELIIISLDGVIRDRARLRDSAALGILPNSFLVYTSGGLWRVDFGGGWTALREDVPGGDRSGYASCCGNVWVFDGSVFHSWNNDTLLWEVSLPGIDGLTQASIDQNVILLMSSDGYIIALQAATGSLCNATRIFGDDRSKLWYRLGDDGVLRVAVADQILALDWEEFIGACA